MLQKGMRCFSRSHQQLNHTQRNKNGQLVYNFSAGPCVLPKEVLLKSQEELMSWNGTGVSVMEMSHRSKDFIQIVDKAEEDFRSLMSVPKNYQVFFFQGGATLQFTAVPFNLLREKSKANYLTTGAWSLAAKKEAQKYCSVIEARQSGEKSDYSTIPDASRWNIDKDSAYFHYCDNETVHGVEFQDFPYESVQDLTLVSDMSSSFCSKPIQWDKYGVVYAGAQKNIGPAGVCIAVIRDDLIGNHRKDTPLMCDWKAFKDASTKFYNTPACWPIYVCGLNIAYMNKIGIKNIQEQATKKSKMLYDFIDSSNGYYTNPVDPKYRSKMNIPFRVRKDDKIEAKFLKQAEQNGLIELKGHRQLGGCRASLYNAMPVEGVQALIDFMKKFQHENN